MEPVRRVVGDRVIEGSCDPRFAPVLDEFERNFRERDEVGASVSITLGGETVVDLWGGTAAGGRPWERDTVTVVFSCTKGATALCAHVLHARGLLDYEAPVGEYWPEFATRGKQDTTVRMMLDHSAGVPVLHEPCKPRGYLDWDYMTGRLADEEPFWKPGTRNGYHMAMFGWTVGELVRRVSGKSLGTFFREEIVEPLGTEFWIGAPDSVEPRFAPVIGYVREKGTPLTKFEEAIVTDRTSIPALAMTNGGGLGPNDPEMHKAEFGAGGGITNGRGLARVYAPFACGGALDGRTYVDRVTLAAMGEVSMATNEDATLMIGTRFALGFMKSIDNRHRRENAHDSVLMSQAAFGHVGAGGSLGFADPREGMSFGYAMNRMGRGILMNERGQSLVDAAYRVLGYDSNAGGVWAK
jgi:CubicO group peptidase (beta-lactamase class C family)